MFRALSVNVNSTVEQPLKVVQCLTYQRGNSFNVPAATENNPPTERLVSQIEKYLKDTISEKKDNFIIIGQLIIRPKKLYQLKCSGKIVYFFTDLFQNRLMFTELLIQSDWLSNEK